MDSNVRPSDTSLLSSLAIYHCKGSMGSFYYLGYYSILVEPCGILEAIRGGSKIGREL